jgi:16S rRNA (adenine1518-N6/adenine1519-N6)-dimethyltransferase
VTLSRPEVQRLLADHGLRPSRALGQNFVVDPNTVRRIVRLAGVTDGAAVVEVGAGLGSLTLALAEAGAQVVAVEVDRGLVPILRQVVADRSVTVVEADALQVDWDELLGPLDRAGLPGAAGGAGLWSLVANLPYNVATPLVVQVLEQAPQVGSLLVMVQREVGERLAARPGQAAYGAVSVVVDYWAEASVVGRVPPTVFVPRPNVESALVRIDRRPSPAVPVTVVTYDRLRQVVRAGFAQRRKMLRRSLAGVVPAAAFAATDIAPEARAEELNVVQWGRLAGWTEET